MSCVSSQIGSRHLPLKQGIVSLSLTWRTNSIGVWCNASIRVLGTRGDGSILSSPKSLPNSNCRFSIAFSQSNQIGNQQSEIDNVFAPVAQMEERDASNVEAAGSSPARSSITDNDLTPKPRRGYLDSRR